MDTIDDLDIVRAVPPATSLRADDGDSGDLGTLHGHFSKFNVWYEINSWWEGKFLERIAKGAFTKTIAERRDQIRCLFDHGYDPQIGNKVLGPFAELREDNEGAYYEVPLFDTSYNRDLLPGLEAGVYGASFRFRVIKEEWNDEPGKSSHNPEGLPERTITEVRLFEAGPVTFGASPAATAGMRSLTDEFYERLRTTNPREYEDLAARAAEIRTPARREAAEGTSPQDPGAAPSTTTDEPARSHSDGLTHAQRRARLHPFLTTKEN